MRNIFDQYDQPENRLTHALATALAEDRRLLARFVEWVADLHLPPSEVVEVVEQGFAGRTGRLEREKETSGLPDACITGTGWAVLIESKVQAVLRDEQLNRHYRTAVRHGLQGIRLLVIDTEAPKRALPSGAVVRTWSAVYAWLLSESRRIGSLWARRAAEYFVVAEHRLVEEEYLREGTLTTFAGIPFDAENPYNYMEAKRVLRLAMDQLRSRARLRRTLGVDPRGKGRGAITGRESTSVWDYIPLRGLKSGEPFTRQPHLTLVIKSDRLAAMVTVPDGVRTVMRRNLTDLGADGFRELLGSVKSRLVRALRGVPGASPWVEVIQRRYPSQRATPIVDARIEFDMRTALPATPDEPKVRLQSEWLGATFEALTRKRSNLQVAIGAVFPYGTRSATANAGILDHVTETWIACAPLIEKMRGR